MDLEEELGPGLGAISPDKGPRALPTVSVNADAEDLYSGIVDSDGAGIFRIQLAQERARADNLQSELDKLKQTHATLNEEHANIVSERDALLTNISVLYKTAKLEIERKDGEIKQLRARLAGRDTQVAREPATTRRDGSSQCRSGEGPSREEHRGENRRSGTDRQQKSRDVHQSREYRRDL